MTRRIVCSGASCLVAAALLLLVSCAPVISEEESAAPSSASTSEPALTGEAPASVEEEAPVGQVAITVHSVRFYDQITGGLGGTYRPKQEGDVFVIVDLAVRNESGSVLKVSPAYLRLIDAQDESCPRTMLIIAGNPYDLKTLKSEEVSPGGEGTGMVVFTAKAGTTLAKVVCTTPKPAVEVSLDGLVVSVPSYRMPRIGEVASGGGIEMVVTSMGGIEKLEKEYGEEFKLVWTEKAKEGQELVLVDIRFKNVSIEPNIAINPLNVLLVDKESQAYGRAIVIALEGQLHVSELSPGEETSGRMLFSMPAGTVLDRLMYKIGALGPPVQVSLR